uniref:Uncharacterized protein n=1 Tax=Mycena chlorophos TaxID=658473 RepID=A0ABQ0LPM4_MYCCL|nr:predicted protein [Mycena chlorophos]
MSAVGRGQSAHCSHVPLRLPSFDWCGRADGLPPFHGQPASDSLGLTATTNVLAARFEEAPLKTGPGPLSSLYGGSPRGSAVFPCRAFFPHTGSSCVIRVFALLTLFYTFAGCCYWLRS